MFKISSISHIVFVLFVTLSVLVLTVSSLAISPARAQTARAKSSDGGVTWYVSPSGNDSNSCADAGLPCLTINGALGKAVAGDMIEVAIGSYTGTGTEVVLINKAITLSGGWDVVFTTQSGLSTIDGQAARRGIDTAGNPVVVDHFQIQHGLGAFGSGIYTHYGSNGGALTLNNSIVSANVSSSDGGGIFNGQGTTLTINNSMVNGNSAGAATGSGAGGGGITLYNSSAVLNNSTVSGNTLLDSAAGSGIEAFGSLTLNNSTVSGNTGGEGLYTFVNTIVLNNSTVTNNQTEGITNRGGHLILQNTLIAGNGNFDCYNDFSYQGTVTSQGYNLIGNGSGCSITPTTGDQVGSGANPIDPKLGPLQDNGGPTFTQALLDGSPALNAGNPAAPGSGGSACLATDQRGVVRATHSPCDIGAYEVDIPLVTIQRSNANPTSASQVDFKVSFSESVTGVNTAAPFSDFALTTTGLTGASITAVNGSGTTYVASVSTGTGNGTLRLDIVDDDSIQDASGRPLGGPGNGNGNYTGGETYSILNFPTPLLPASPILDTTPTYQWTLIPGATKYQFQLIHGTKTIYSKIVDSKKCRVSNCSSTPINILPYGVYKWHVRAMIDGVWMSYSDYKVFSVVRSLAPKAGFWSSPGIEFYVASSRASVDHFAVYINVSGCGLQGYKLVYSPSVPVVKAKFSQAGAFYFSGIFNTLTTSTGRFGLKNYYLSGCGYLTGGPFAVAANWRNSGQSLSADSNEYTLTLVGPALGAEYFFYDIDIVNQSPSLTTAP